MDKLLELAERLDAHGERLAKAACDPHQVNAIWIGASANCFAVAAALRARASQSSNTGDTDGQ